MRRNNNGGDRYSKDIKPFKGLSVEVRNNDVNFALRKFKKKIQEDGLLQELREREFYQKPSEKRARAKAAGIARWKKKLQKNEIELLGGGPSNNKRK